MVVGDGCCSHTLDANRVSGYVYIYIEREREKSADPIGVERVRAAAITNNQ